MWWEVKDCCKNQRRTLRSETILTTESPLKWWKRLFISLQKLFLFSRYLSFCLDFLVMQQIGLIRKIRLNSNLMTSQPGWQIILIQILLDISRSKGNQAMRIGQLIECNMTNIFLRKSYTKCGGGTCPRPFSEKIKFSISLDQ